MLSRASGDSMGNITAFFSFPQSLSVSQSQSFDGFDPDSDSDPDMETR